MTSYDDLMRESSAWRRRLLIDCKFAQQLAAATGSKRQVVVNVRRVKNTRDEKNDKLEK